MDSRPACMTPEVRSGALSSWTCRVPGKLRPSEHQDARCGWGRGPLRVAASPAGARCLSSLSRPEAASAHRERRVSARTCTGACPGHRGQQRGSIRGRAERCRGRPEALGSGGEGVLPGGPGAAPLSARRRREENGAGAGHTGGFPLGRLVHREESRRPWQRQALL